MAKSPLLYGKGPLLSDNIDKVGGQKEKHRAGEKEDGHPIHLPILRGERQVDGDSRDQDGEELNKGRNDETAETLKGRKGQENTDHKLDEPIEKKALLKATKEGPGKTNIKLGEQRAFRLHLDPGIKRGTENVIL